jgi:hypothetical protein
VPIRAPHPDADVERPEQGEVRRVGNLVTHARPLPADAGIAQHGSPRRPVVVVPSDAERFADDGVVDRDEVGALRRHELGCGRAAEYVHRQEAVVQGSRWPFAGDGVLVCPQGVTPLGDVDQQRPDVIGVGVEDRQRGPGRYVDREHRDRDEVLLGDPIQIVVVGQPLEPGSGEVEVEVGGEGGDSPRALVSSDVVDLCIE